VDVFCINPLTPGGGLKLRKAVIVKFIKKIQVSRWGI
jgi:hypothetical protein